MHYLQIGLAVGDITAVKEGAALRQIRMQVERLPIHKITMIPINVLCVIQISLLVELEAALPSWFLDRVQVVTSSRSSERNMLRRWVKC